jgi:hypothetical protein
METSIDNSEHNNYVVASFEVRRMDKAKREKVHVDVDDESFEYVDRSEMTNRYVHQNRFTSLYSMGASLTVLNRGIPEYKVEDEAMEITLLRGVNKIGNWIRSPRRQYLTRAWKNDVSVYSCIRYLSRDGTIVYS